MDIRRKSKHAVKWRQEARFPQHHLVFLAFYYRTHAHSYRTHTHTLIQNTHTHTHTEYTHTHTHTEYTHTTTGKSNFKCMSAHTFRAESSRVKAASEGIRALSSMCFTYGKCKVLMW